MLPFTLWYKDIFLRSTTTPDLEDISSSESEVDEDLTDRSNGKVGNYLSKIGGK